MNTKDALKAARDNLAELRRQQQSILTRITELEQGMGPGRERIQKADAALDDAIRAELRGLATPADVETAKAALEAAQSSHDKNEHFHRLAVHESRKIDQERMHAELAERKALDALKAALVSPLEERIRNDAKLRGELLAIYGLYSAKTGFADWDIVIADLFPHPTEAEIKQAISAAEPRLESA